MIVLAEPKALAPGDPQQIHDSRMVLALQSRTSLAKMPDTQPVFSITLVAQRRQPQDRHDRNVLGHGMGAARLKPR